MSNDITNYTQEVLHKTYEEDGGKYGFSIYPEYFSDEDGLGVTGKKLVVAITPQGSFCFPIEISKAGWKSGNPYYDGLMIMIHINTALITGQSVSQN